MAERTPVLIAQAIGGACFEVAPGLGAYTITDSPTPVSRWTPSGPVLDYRVVAHGHFEYDMPGVEDVQTGPLPGCRYCQGGVPLRQYDEGRD